MDICKTDEIGMYYSLEYSKFCWEPSIDELAKFGNDLNRFADDKLEKYFLVRDRTPHVYVREGDVAVGIKMSPKLSINKVAIEKRARALGLGFIERD
jgi:hypothetical protein